MKKISVMVADEVHAAVRTRAFREGVTMDELGRRYFEGYAAGGLVAGGVKEDGETLAGREPAVRSEPLPRSPEPPATSALAAGEDERSGEKRDPLPSGRRGVASTPEHSPAASAKKGLCAHRVPIGSFCRRCENEKVAA